MKSTDNVVCDSTGGCRPAYFAWGVENEEGGLHFITTYIRSEWEESLSIVVSPEPDGNPPGDVTLTVTATGKWWVLLVKTTL